ncbi:hypothetical protein BH18ACT13_BH18ACT13_20880 [soil metagenome]
MVEEGKPAPECGIRDAWGEFGRAGVHVLAVSPDDEASRVDFKQRYGLPLPDTHAGEVLAALAG